MALARGLRPLWTRLHGRQCATIQALVDRRLKPLCERETQLEKRKKELETMQAALSGELTDATRRQTEAQEHASFQWSKKKEKLEMIGKWHDEKHQKVSELNGMKSSIKQKAREIGDQSIDERLAEVHNSKNLDLYEFSCSKESTSLRDYARQHHLVLSLAAQIKDARAAAARAEQLAEQKAQLAREAEEEAQRLETALAAHGAHVDEVCQHLEEVAKERQETELYEEELRNTVAWARQLAPDLLEVTAEGLALLRLQRRQRLEALLAPGDLLGLRCSAGELRSYPRAVARLRDLGLRAWDLKKMGFSVKELAEDYGAGEVCNAGYSKDELLEYPAIVQRLKESGRKASDLKKMGFSVKELAEDYSAAEVFRAGYSKDELLDYPVVVSKLKKLGLPASELKRTGFCVQELAKGGYTAVQLRDAGFSKSELMKIYPERITMAALASDLGDFLKPELKEAGYSAQQVFPDSLAPTAWFRYKLI